MRARCSPPPQHRMGEKTALLSSPLSRYKFRLSRSIACPYRQGRGQSMKGNIVMVRGAWVGLSGMALWGVSPVMGQGARTPPEKIVIPVSASKVVAVINGDKITHGQLDPLLRQAAASSPDL